MVSPLGAADTAETLRLLRARPLHNVYLEYVVRRGALALMPGFFGFRTGGRLEGVMLISSQGTTVLDVRDPLGFEALARFAASNPVAPRHIVGSEDVSAPFWRAYAPFAPPPLWERSEPVYLVDRRDRRSCASAPSGVKVAVATERDLDEVVENSARQHLEDLKVDRRADDPRGFEERHRAELRDGRWWVVRDRGRIAFQAHVGPENEEVVQVGGVFTPPERRGQGFGIRGMAALVDRLLERLPAVTLFCDEDNATARHVYERVGFREVFRYRSWLLG